jgi:hypothetical protein
MNVHGKFPANQPIFKAPGVVVGLIALLATVHLALEIGGTEIRLWVIYTLVVSDTRVSARRLGASFL